MGYLAILFTGSRTWHNKALVRKVLVESKPDLVIHGGARGLDRIVDEAAREKGICVWKMDYLGTLGRVGGTVRNRAMLHILLWMGNLGWKIEVHAFPHKDGSGTQHMMKIAKQEMVDVFNHGAPEDTWIKPTTPTSPPQET